MRFFSLIDLSYRRHRKAAGGTAHLRCGSRQVLLIAQPFVFHRRLALRDLILVQALKATHVALSGI